MSTQEDPLIAASVRSGLFDLGPPKRMGASIYYPERTGRRLLRRLAPEGAAPVAASDELLERFAGLGDELHRLAPAGSAVVYSGFTEAGEAFWVTEPPVLTLDAWLQGHEAPAGETIDAFIRALARFLAALHEQGLIHGALAPRAVDISEGEVRLFGHDIDLRSLFRTAGGPGDMIAPGYAAPEAHDAAGRKPLGPATDIYAAGAILHRLHTGQAPLAANSLDRLSGGGLWPEDAPAIDDRRRQAIEKALSPMAADRPQDVRAWLDDLGLSMTGEGDADAPWFSGAEKPVPPEIVTPVFAPVAEVVPQVAPAPAAPVAAGWTQSPSSADVAAPVFPRKPLPWRLGLAGAAVLAVAGAGLAAVWLGRGPADEPETTVVEAPLPPAPDTCEWRRAGEPSSLTLFCDEDGRMVRAALPPSFDSETVRLAAAGYGAAQERLGAFYRVRARAFPEGSAIAENLARRARAAFADAAGRPGRERFNADAARAANLALGDMALAGERGEIDPRAAEGFYRAVGSGGAAAFGLARALEAQGLDDPARREEALRLYDRLATTESGYAPEAAEALERLLEPGPTLVAPEPVAAVPTATPPQTSAPGTRTPTTRAPVQAPRPATTTPTTRPQPPRTPPATTTRPTQSAPRSDATASLNERTGTTLARQFGLSVTTRFPRERGVYEIVRSSGIQACNGRSASFVRATGYSAVNCDGDDGLCSVQAQVTCQLD